MEKESKIYVAGHRGMVGSAIVRKLTSLGYTNLLTRTSSELDLRNQQNVADFFEVEKQEYVFLAAAKVGGIVANNTYRADFLYENLAIQNNIIHGSYVNKVKKLMFLGSSCIYPKLAPQPLKESYLLSGYLEPTNEPYAIAKIAGIKMCESYNFQYNTNYKCLMPCNLYGPNDNFHPDHSHMIPGIIHRAYNCKQNNEDFVIWGDGSPLRQFIHSKDLAKVILWAIDNWNSDVPFMAVNDNEHSVMDIVKIVAKKFGIPNDKLIFDETKPRGQFKKPAKSDIPKNFKLRHAFNPSCLN